MITFKITFILICKNNFYNLDLKKKCILYSIYQKFKAYKRRAKIRFPHMRYEKRMKGPHFIYQANTSRI